MQLQYENDKAILVIPESFPKDGGIYIVTARNLAGESFSSCNVTVKGRLPNETSDSEIASDMEPIKPSVQLPLKDITISEGKSTRLDCVIIGQPEPEVIWYHNNRPVKESQDVRLLFQGDRCSLLIKEAYLEDAGEYKVAAINSAGEAFSICNLTIITMNDMEPATRNPIERIIPIESPPKFEKLLIDILAPEGDKIVFDCILTGDPQPTIKWFLNNKEIYENERIKFVQTPDGAVKLIIENVSIDDKGVYTVKASNGSGDAKCFSHLIVKSVNTTEGQEIIQTEIDEKLISPTFKELFLNKTVHESDCTKFECIVVGKPTPKVKWFFNNEPVHGKDFLVSTSGDRQVLTIPEVNQNTVGKISCVAENEVGKATCVAHLSLFQDPSLPFATSHSMEEQHNTGSSQVTIKKQVFSSSSSSHTSTIENGVPKTQIHSVSSHFETPLITETKQSSEYHQANDLPSTLHQKSVASFINTTGSTVSNVPKITRKNIAPRFVSPLIGKIVDQGSDVHLEGIVDGYPSPEIKLTKNGEDLFDLEGHVNIRRELNKITVDLKNVGIKDAGRYTCVANNAAGTSTSTADVVVKSKLSILSNFTQIIFFSFFRISLPTSFWKTPSSTSS